MLNYDTRHSSVLLAAYNEVWNSGDIPAAWRWSYLFTKAVNAREQSPPYLRSREDLRIDRAKQTGVDSDRPPTRAEQLSKQAMHDGLHRAGRDGARGGQPEQNNTAPT